MKCNQKINLIHHYQQENYTIISVESEKKTATKKNYKN